VFTGDWIPDYELARAAGIAIDPGTRGPAVDTAAATSVPFVHAAGNLVHAAETADVAALGGVHAARHIAAALRDGSHTAGDMPPGARPQSGGPPAHRLPITVESPLAWISPNAVTIPAPDGAAANAAASPTPAPTQPSRGRFVLRSHVFRHRALLEVRQGDRVLARSRARLIPGRPVRLDAAWLAEVRPADGPVSVALARA
jgi:hypothetical protein